ncbi:MAG: hypothetical protein GX025_06745 [Clostridiales bacterium]|nr:hypothetical protein [Clostridiales bacterium]
MKLRKRVVLGFLVVAIAGWVATAAGLVNNLLMGGKLDRLQQLQQTYVDETNVLSAHYNWRHSLLMSVTYETEFKGSTDPNTCALGTWLNSESAHTNDEEILRLIQEVNVPHAQMHQQAQEIKDLMSKGKMDEARRIFSNEILPKTNQTIDLLQQMEVRYSELLDRGMLGTVRLQNVNKIEMFVLLAASIALGIIFIRGTLKALMPPLKSLTQAAGGLLLGKLDVESDYTTDDEIGRLFGAFQNLTDSMKQQAEVLDKLAAGDYTVSIDMRSEEDRVNKSIQTLCDKTREALTQVHMVAGQVSLGSEQIAQASTSLATGSTQQAATIEDFSGRIDRVKQAAENNAQQAAETYNSSREASELMQRSVDDMAAMLDAMDSISDMSTEISKVIKVIDDIAFQTNILALNASVEAARAGQHGKGFAVVAEEVRNLAAKSAEAAKETAVLLERSVANVDAGNIIVKRVSEGLKAVDELTMKNAGAVEAINADSHRQSEMMEEINEGIAQISSVVQLNSATAEETAAAAQEMSAQSTILDESVNRFRLS